MKRKHIIIICISVMLIAIVIVIWQAPLHLVLLPDEKGITADKAFKEMPYKNISSDDIELLNRLKSSPEIEAAINTGTLFDLFGDEARNLVGDMLLGYDELSVSVANGAVYVFYKAGNYGFFLTLLTDGAVTKTIAVYKVNGDVKTIYENRNNETYQEYQFRLRFG